jgi:hypothetical protein
MVSVIGDAAILRSIGMQTFQKLNQNTNGCNCRAVNVILCTFESEALGECNETHLRGAVIGLTKITWDTI